MYTLSWVDQSTFIAVNLRNFLSIVYQNTVVDYVVLLCFQMTPCSIKYMFPFISKIKNVFGNKMFQLIMSCRNFVYFMTCTFRHVIVANETCNATCIIYIPQFTPAAGPIDGGTVITIHGSNLGMNFKDIKGIMIGNVQCIANETSYVVGRRYVYNYVTIINSYSYILIVYVFTVVE